MAREIERKFLLRDARWRASVTRAEHIRQGYLGGTPAVSIRVRIADDAASLNFKSATLGISRHEFEYPIPRADAEEMLALFCGERRLEKTRHYVPWGTHLWDRTRYRGRNFRTSAVAGGGGLERSTLLQRLSNRFPVSLVVVARRLSRAADRAYNRAQNPVNTRL